MFLKSVIPAVKQRNKKNKKIAIKIEKTPKRLGDIAKLRSRVQHGRLSQKSVKELGIVRVGLQEQKQSRRPGYTRDTTKTGNIAFPQFLLLFLRQE